MITLVHVINLPNRTDRRESIFQQSREQGFEIQFWPGVTNNLRRCTNISHAFKQIVRWAKEKDLSSVTIAEDDAIFTAPGAWQYYLQHLPQDYDTYLGGIYSGQLNGNRIVNGYSGNTLLTVHQNFYEFFLSANENDHLDRWLGNFAFEKKYYLTLPFVVRQNGSYSDNHMKKPDYTVFEEQWKYFSGVNNKCG